MIERIYLNQYSRPADALAVGSMADGLVLDPPYQRGSVWTELQRRSLVLSMLQGLPIGAVFINHRTWNASYVVDGRQRIETVRAFINEGFTVPGEWVGTGGELYFTEMPLRAQRTVRDALIATYETNLKTEADEADLYHRINFGGTPHEFVEAPPRP